MRKVKCVKIEVGHDCFTIGKIYDVLRIDEDGDIFVIDDKDERYFFYPSEVEFVDEE